MNKANISEDIKEESTTIKYAGFWKRLVAYLIDSVIVTILSIIFATIIIELGNSASYVKYSNVVMGWGFIIAWTYFASFESSSYQATLGKKALSIKVTDMNGKRISVGKANGRFFGKILSTILLFFGYIMIAFTKQKQALHDQMAECLVVVE